MTAATISADAPVRDRLAPVRAAWRSILVHVQPEADAHPRLLAAADLAKRLDATLIGLGAEMIPPMATTDSYGILGGDFMGALIENLQTNLKNARSAFDNRARGLKAEWADLQDRPADAVERLARGADLIVTGGGPLNYRDTSRWADPAELVIKAGRPVLVVPPAGGTLSAKSIVVAWKDSREARRALADAMPLLMAAETVTIVETCAEADAEDLKPHHTSLLRHLERHGVKAKSRIMPGRLDGTVEVLQAEARDAGADLIVSGAYGHNRFGEWVFGGVTADLLADPRRFLLLSH